MELLTQLEERIAVLLSRMDSLAAENAELKARLEASSSLEEENSSLRETVAEERRKNELALGRVDAILARLKELPE
jgi:cell shape-determining protein MreC